MLPPCLWAPSLEPHTIINSYAYKHAIISECIRIGKEESKYESQINDREKDYLFQKNIELKAGVMKPIIELEETITPSNKHIKGD
ncbi:7232_t:CDS:2 [Entrophospora sp. SA101]|nr:7232_t:CDS:2 [Entrophospora sp. SA101]CAJ0917776.1 16101_t:CDS:2 [Entrophospora sp. SA101]